MLTVDISFIFHLFFIAFGCEVVKNIFFIPLYESVFLEMLHTKALSNAFLTEIEKLDQNKLLYENHNKNIINEFRRKVSLVYKKLNDSSIANRLELLPENILDEVERDKTADQKIDKIAKDYVSFIIKKVYC